MKTNKSVLFLPFLQIPSGHHQVANALIDKLSEVKPSIKCEKVDILSYSYGIAEKVISSIYLKWICTYPNIYNFIYQHAVYRNMHKEKRYRLYELLFLSFMKKLVMERKPNLIICTHSLPAYMLNLLKRKNLIHVPVINVYTDYFIHRFWGIENIDYHFVPTYQVQKFLIERGVKKEKIYITGIPVHANIKKQKSSPLHPSRSTYRVLVSGGNLGVGVIDELIEDIKKPNPSCSVEFIVLCGKNNKLFDRITALQLKHISAYPFIHSPYEMNRIYDRVDAIITKPGGVTISECLFKRKPIFIYHTLPGQERINLDNLIANGLVFSLKKSKICEQIHDVFHKKQELMEYQRHLDTFHANIHRIEPEEIIAEILRQ